MKKIIAAAAVVVLFPALALAQKTTFDFDKTADFSQYKTYSLKDGTKVGQPLIDNRIVAAIETELAAKGLKKSEAASDIVVVYHVAFDKQQDIQAYTSGFGGYGGYGYRYGGGWGSTTTDVRVNQILVGTLVVDIADSAKKEVVWRGMGVKEIDTQAKADKRDKNINSAVKKILKDFPPKKKA
jgi:Domain of unknown function (DUF4136)